MTTNLVLNRPHRFAVGDSISHVDGGGAMMVEERTYRLVGDSLYPTYRLVARDPYTRDYEFIDDVLDTEDLVAL